MISAPTTPRPRATALAAAALALLWSSAAPAAEPAAADLPAAGDVSALGAPQRGPVVGEAVTTAGAIAALGAIACAIAYDQQASAQADAVARYDRLWAGMAPPQTLAAVASEARQARDRADAWSIGAWTLAGVGAVALGVGIALLATEDSAPSDAAATAPTLRPVVGPASVGLLGAF